MKNAPKWKGLTALSATLVLACSALIGAAPAMADDVITDPITTEQSATDPIVPDPAPAEPVQEVAPAPAPEPAPEPAPIPEPAPEPAPIVEEAPAPEPIGPPVPAPTEPESAEALQASVIAPLVEPEAVEDEIPPANLLGSAGGSCPPVPPGEPRDDFVLRITLVNGTTETVPVVQTGTITATVLYAEGSYVLEDGVFTRTLASGEQAFITYPHPLAPRLEGYPYKVVFTNADTGAEIGHSYVADYEGVCSGHETPVFVAPVPDASVKETGTDGQALIEYTVLQPTGPGEYTSSTELTIRVGGTDVKPVTAEPGVPGSTTVDNVCGPDGALLVEVVDANGNVVADSEGLDFGCVTDPGDPVVVPAEPVVVITAGPNPGQVTVESSNPLPGGENTTTTEVTLGVEVGGTPLAPIVLAPGGSDSLVLNVCSPDGAQLVVVSYNDNPLATSEGVAVSCAPGDPSTVPATPYAYFYLFEGDLYAWLDNPETHDPEHFVPEDILYEFEQNGNPYEGGDPITVEGGSTVQDYLVYADFCQNTDPIEFTILATKYNYTVESGNLYDPENELYVACDDPGNGGGNGNSELCAETGTGWQTKVDVSGNRKTVTVNAPEGYLISFTCVKAGTDAETLPVNPPASTVVISHTSGKDVSHYQVYLIAINNGGETPGGEQPGSNPDNGANNPGGPDKPGKDKGPKKAKASVASSDGELALTGTSAEKVAAQQWIGGTTIVVMAIVIAFMVGFSLKRKRENEA